MLIVVLFLLCFPGYVVHIALLESPMSQGHCEQRQGETMSSTAGISHSPLHPQFQASDSVLHNHVNICIFSFLDKIVVFMGYIMIIQYICQ